MKPGSHISCSQEFRKVWGNEPSHSQVNSHFGQFFTGKLQGSKLIALKIFLYHWKDFGKYMFKMRLHDPFGHLKHKLWPEEGPRVKLAIWFPTTKSRESPWFPCMQGSCHIRLERSQWRIQLCFRPHLNGRSAPKVMGLQNHRSPHFGNFGTPTWQSWDKITFGCWSRA
jgi:hypothetical protein